MLEIQNVDFSHKYSDPQQTLRPISTASVGK